MRVLDACPRTGHLSPRRCASRRHQTIEIVECNRRKQFFPDGERDARAIPRGCRQRFQRRWSAVSKAWRGPVQRNQMPTATRNYSCKPPLPIAPKVHFLFPHPFHSLVTPIALKCRLLFSRRNATMFVRARFSESPCSDFLCMSCTTSGTGLSPSCERRCNLYLRLHIVGACFLTSRALEKMIWHCRGESSVSTIAAQLLLSAIPVVIYHFCRHGP